MTFGSDNLTSVIVQPPSLNVLSPWLCMHAHAHASAHARAHAHAHTHTRARAHTHTKTINPERHRPKANCWAVAGSRRII